MSDAYLVQVWCTRAHNRWNNIFWIRNRNHHWSRVLYKVLGYRVAQSGMYLVSLRKIKVEDNDGALSPF